MSISKEIEVKANVGLHARPAAEFVKLAENAYRDVNIAFANELSIVAKNLELDILELISLANRHPRVKILNPGCGVGGHCIAVDPWFLAAINSDNSRLVQMSRKLNSEKTIWVYEQVIAEANKFSTAYKRPPRIVCLGLAFKPNVGDIRNSPAEKIAKLLYDHGHNVKAVDPYIKTHELIPLTDCSTAKRTSDIAVILVPHTEFIELKKTNFH